MHDAGDEAGSGVGLSTPESSAEPASFFASARVSSVHGSGTVAGGAADGETGEDTFAEGASELAGCGDVDDVAASTAGWPDPGTVCEQPTASTAASTAEVSAGLAP